MPEGAPAILIDRDRVGGAAIRITAALHRQNGNRGQNHYLYEEMLDTLKGLQSNFTVAHFGMFRGQSGAASAGFKRFLDLLRHGERRCWVKLTAPYRIGSPPLYEDAVPIARALIEAAPDRTVWGSDYPFLSHTDRVSAAGLFDLIPTWAPDESVRQRILVDNPQELFGF